MRARIGRGTKQSLEEVEAERVLPMEMMMELVMPMELMMELP